MSVSKRVLSRKYFITTVLSSTSLLSRQYLLKETFVASRTIRHGKDIIHLVSIHLVELPLKGATVLLIIYCAIFPSKNRTKM